MVMLPPDSPSSGVADGWKCDWTASGAKLLLDILVGNVAVPASLTVAACNIAPLFNDSKEITSDALSTVELRNLPTPGEANGYSRGTLTIASVGAAYGYGPAKADSGNEISFGTNDGGTNWPGVGALVLLNGSTPLCSITIGTSSIVNTPAHQLRIANAFLTLMAATEGM